MSLSFMRLGQDTDSKVYVPKEKLTLFYCLEKVLVDAKEKQYIFKIHNNRREKPYLFYNVIQFCNQMTQILLIEFFTDS